MNAGPYPPDYRPAPEGKVRCPVSTCIRGTTESGTCWYCCGTGFVARDDRLVMPHPGSAK